MEAFKTAATIDEKGELRLDHLPFEPGEQVEVILLSSQPSLAPAQSSPNRYPLRGKPIRYEKPTEPVAVDDWEVLR